MTATSKDKRKALGRGLGALLPQTPTPRQTSTKAQVGDKKVATAHSTATKTTNSVAETKPEKRTYFTAQVEDIYPSPEQPRRRFDEALLDELAQSIRHHGVIQPLIVRARSPEGYFLIAGERRWRACQRAGITSVPIVIREVSSKESFEQALVENLQRSDLNAIEEALAFQRLGDEFQLTQEQIATRVGKERSTVANSLRLLRLPTSVRTLVEAGSIGMGHARALLSLPTDADMETCARTITKDGLSVRATEALVRKQLRPTKPKPQPKPKNASVRDVENRLTQSLGAAVHLTEKANGKGGRIEIAYANLDDLDRLLERLL